MEKEFNHFYNTCKNLKYRTLAELLKGMGEKCDFLNRYHDEGKGMGLTMEYTPLMAAINYHGEGNPQDLKKTVELLLFKKRNHPRLEIDVNLVDSLEQRTALFNAAQWGLSDVVKLLLQHERIDVNKKCKNMNPLSRACKYKKTKVVEILLRDGRSQITETTMHWAQIAGGEILSQVLEESGVPPLIKKKPQKQSPEEKPVPKKKQVPKKNDVIGTSMNLPTSEGATKKALVKFDHKASNPNTLTVKVGILLNVIEESGEWVMCYDPYGQRYGYVARNHLSFVRRAKKPAERMEKKPKMPVFNMPMVQTLPPMRKVQPPAQNLPPTQSFQLPKQELVSPTRSSPARIENTASFTSLEEFFKEADLPGMYVEKFKEQKFLLRHFKLIIKKPERCQKILDTIFEVDLDKELFLDFVEEQKHRL